MTHRIKLRTEPTLDTRAFALELRFAPEGDGRTVEGRAIPWDSPTDLGYGIREQFQRGSLIYQLPMSLYGEHGHMVGQMPVGVITDFDDRDDGLYMRARLSDTQAGRDAATLVVDRAITGLSIGFSGASGDIRDGDLITRTHAVLREVSLVGVPAYTDASITGIRNQTTTTKEIPTMEEDARVSELADRATDLDRRLQLLETNTPPTGTGLRFSCLAEAIKGLGKEKTTTRDDLAQIEAAYIDARAYTGATTADSLARPAWIDRDIKLVDKGRRVLDLFNAAPLPPEGNSIEYPKLKALLDNTGEQVAEGDALGMVKLEVDTASSPVKTYGNFARLTKQVIDRSSVAYLAKVLEAQMIGYGKRTNKVVRDALTSATGTGTLDMSANLTKPGAWIDTAVAAVASIDDDSVGLAAEFWVMSVAHFRILAGIADGAGRPVFAVNGDGQNTIGAVTARSLTANVMGLPVVVDPGLTGNFSYIAAREALTVWESPGAPFRLTDDGVETLTSEFALYGYLATSLDDAKGIVKVKMSA